MKIVIRSRRGRLTACMMVISLFTWVFPGMALCAGWGEPEFIDLGWEYEARDPKLVMDDFGNAFCAFDHYNLIYVNRYEGSSWGAPELLNPDEGFCTEGGHIWDIDCSPGGDAIFVCNYRHEGVCGLYARHYTSGTWGYPAPIVIAVSEYLEVNSPNVAHCADGTALCTFIRREDGHNNLYASHFDGAAWSSPYFIAQDAVDCWHAYSSPQVAIDDATGDGLCVFYRVVDGVFYTYASIYSGGVWSEAAAIGPAGPVDGDLPEAPLDLAFDGSGNALCAFSVPGASGDPRAVYVNRFSGGSWEGAVRVDDGPDGQPWGYPHLAVNAGGDAICAFTRGNAPPYGYARAYANVYTSGTGWGGPQRIDQFLDGFGFSPVVDFDGFGGAVSVFIGPRHMGCGGMILSRDVEHTCANYYSSGDWTGWEYFGGRGSLPYCFDSGNADLAVDYYGNALCAYELTLPGGSTSRIYAVRYTSDNPTPTPTPVPTTTPTPDGRIRVNYQPEAAPPVRLFMIDAGEAYGDHGQYSYGW